MEEELKRTAFPKDSSFHSFIAADWASSEKRTDYGSCVGLGLKTKKDWTQLRLCGNESPQVWGIHESGVAYGLKEHHGQNHRDLTTMASRIWFEIMTCKSRANLARTVSFNEGSQ